MDSRGTIYGPTEIQELEAMAKAGDAEAAKKLDRMLPLTTDEATQMEGMNRAQRRAFYSNERRKRPRFGGATNEK
jgi:hypothetical protein